MSAWLERLHRRSDAAAQPSAAVRNDDSVDVREVFQNLQSDRAVACDDVRVAHRMNEPPLHARILVLQKYVPPGVIRHLDDSRPETSDGRELRLRGVIRHDHAT